MEENSFTVDCRPPMKLDTLREVQQWDDAYAFMGMGSKAGSSVDREVFHLDDPMKFIDTETLSVWDLSDIAKAGMLLRKPQITCSFENEHEMRRVYSLIYDVFRCECLVALHSVGHRSRQSPVTRDVTGTGLVDGGSFERTLIQIEPIEQTLQSHKIGNLFTSGMY